MIFWGINKKNIFRSLILRVFLVVIIIGSVFFIYLRFARATSVNLYPGSCLGSWQNPHLAQGRPDVSDINLINKDNAAVFSDGGIKEIYCGSFNSDLSENEIKLIKSVTLKFSWLISDLPQASSDQTATSSITIIQSPATSSEEVASSTNYVVNQILDNVHADEVKLIISTTTSEITVTTNTLTFEVAATSISKTASTTTENAAAIENNIATSSPTSFWWKKFNLFFADDQVNNAQIMSNVGVATSSLDDPIAPTEDFLKVSYTLDGVNWRALGMVDKNNWQNISFQIPVYQLEDIKKIQIKIESLPLLNKMPPVYLDGIWLEVEPEISESIYNLFSGKTISVDKTSLKIDKSCDDNHCAVALNCADDNDYIYVYYPPYTASELWSNISCQDNANRTLKFYHGDPSGKYYIVEAKQQFFYPLDYIRKQDYYAGETSFELTQ